MNNPYYNQNPNQPGSYQQGQPRPNQGQYPPNIPYGMDQYQYMQWQQMMMQYQMNMGNMNNRGNMPNMPNIPNIPNMGNLPGVT